MNANKRIVLVCGCLWLMASVNARAWDGTGHMLVAQIARDRLTDKARARVDALVAEVKSNDVPYNAVNVACWPDDIKGTGVSTQFHNLFKPWHYIDIGCSTNDPDEIAHPPTMTVTNGDVISAINRCIDIIKTKKTDDMVPSEPIALALLIHFVGDIHQPLHCSARFNPDPKPGDKYKHDAGGNAVTLSNLADTPWGKNLHTFWDEAYRRYYDAGQIKALPPLNEWKALGSDEMKAWLEKLKPDAPDHPDLTVNIVKWANETHAIGCAQVYGTLNEPYGAKNVALPEKYVTEATATARRQLVLAGYRLAQLLNDLYGQ